MDALMANNRALTSWAATRSRDTTPYLTFTAEEANSSVALNKNKDVPELNARLEYRMGRGTWQKYTWDGVNGLVIPLTNIGDSCQFRAEDVNETFNVNSGILYKFTETGVVSSSGDIMSLLDKSLANRNVPDGAFNYLFGQFRSGDSTIILDFEHVGVRGLRRMYDLKSGIKSSQNITAKSAGDGAFDGTFEYCPYMVGLDVSVGAYEAKGTLNNLCRRSNYFSKLKVSFHSWDIGTDNWVQGVSPTGTFTCPAELPVIFGDSNIPWGWKVDNGLTTVSEEEVLNACYQYKNGQLIIQPDFKACLNRAEQVDFTFKGKVYWKAGTPLPNPHRPTTGGGYYYVGKLDNLFKGYGEVPSVDLSQWDVKNVTSSEYMYDFSRIKSIDLSMLEFDSLQSMERMFGFWKGTLLNLPMKLMTQVTSVEDVCFNAGKVKVLDFSNIDCSHLVAPVFRAFQGCTSVTTAYARTQEDCDKLNASEGKPTTWKFVVKPQ